MSGLYLFCATIFIITISLVHCFDTGATEDQRICFRNPIYLRRKISCNTEQFQCLNNKVIKRNLYCYYGNHCGDNSDEEYCNTVDCPEFFTKCESSNKCIPNEWICDGRQDCPSNEDESNCEDYRSVIEEMENTVKASILSVEFLYKRSKRESAMERWGFLVDKTAVALFLSDYSGLIKTEMRKEIAYEVSIQFLFRLFRTDLQDISSTELASFVNAFLVSCINPRKFYGVDIVQELRTRVNLQNYTNPYVLLSLCNAGESLTESDKLKLIDIFRNKRRSSWTSMQAVAVMALACAREQPGNITDADTLREFTKELKQHQYRNGSMENLRTTALVMQALLSVEGPEADPDNFNERKALEQILLNQKPDGSFGNFMNTYFVLPILNCKSLVSISTDHCETIYTNETPILVDIATRSGPKMRVQYSLWIGNEKDLERNLVVRVPANVSLYAVMEIAAEIDSRYKFEYVVKNHKPFVNAISDIEDDPERGKFWFLYTIKDGEPVPAQESPADVIPEDNDHFVMWYRSGLWIE